MTSNTIIALTSPPWGPFQRARTRIPPRQSRRPAEAHLLTHSERLSRHFSSGLQDHQIRRSQLRSQGPRLLALIGPSVCLPLRSHD
jgi:hypothetical protein